MKILIATDRMDIGGAETHVFTLIGELRKIHRVTLISSGGVYAQILKESGIRCVNAPFDKRDFLSIKKSKKILEKEMKIADIVHTHTRFTSFLAKKIRGSSALPKIVTTAHLNFPLFPFGSFAFWGDGTLAVSEDIRDYLHKNYHINKENIALTKNSVNFSEYRVSSCDKKLIIHTSRIDTGRAKCAFLLVEAANEILSKHKDWRIMIVGDGNRFSKLSKKAKEVNEMLGFSGVILTGARSDIPELLSRGGIFVGVSRSALEGMASGLPTVICGDEGYGGIATNENFNLLSATNFCARGLPAPTKNLLIRDIEFLISSPQKRRCLGEEMRKLMRLSYNSLSMANDALICYQKVFNPPAICLLGYFGYNNLGDEETLASAIKILKSKGVSKISILSAKGKYTDIFPFVKYYDRTAPKEIIRAIERCDVLALCGGNLMQNETSLRSLAYYEQITALAKRHGKRIYLLSSGFGEIHGTIGKMLLKKGIRSADFCGCRTRHDLDTAKNFTEHAVLMPDFCFLLPQNSQKHIDKKFFAWIISNKETVSVYDIEEIANARGLIPVVINLFDEKDKSVGEKLKKRGIKVTTPKNYNDVSNILTQSAFSINERLHGAIFSILSHTPAYITDSSEKNRALINEISSRKKGKDIIFPFSKNDVLQKKEIGACDSDFNYVVDSLKQDVLSALNEIF